MCKTNDRVVALGRLLMMLGVLLALTSSGVINIAGEAQATKNYWDDKNVNCVVKGTTCATGACVRDKNNKLVCPAPPATQIQKIANAFYIEAYPARVGTDDWDYGETIYCANQLNCICIDYGDGPTCVASKPNSTTGIDPHTDELTYGQVNGGPEG